MILDHRSKFVLLGLFFSLLTITKSIRLSEMDGSMMALRPPPKRPMPIQERIKPAEITEPPPPKEIAKPPILPPKESLNVLPPHSKNAEKAEAKWWSNVYANAPESVKRVIVPKERQVGKEHMEEKPFLLVQTPTAVVKVEATINDTPKEVLAKLEKLTKLPAINYYLYRGLNHLSENVSLESQGVTTDERLLMKLAPVALARLPSANAPVSQLKELLSSSMVIPAHKLYLLYNNAPLTKSLKEHGVPHGATIDVNIVPTLNVLTPNGNVVHIDPSPSALIRDVKSLLTSKTGIAAVTQKLKYHDKVLEDGQSLSGLGVPVGATINLEIRPGVTVKLEDGRSIPIKVMPTDPVDTVKKRLKDAAGIEPDQCSCYYSGKPLLDHSSLADQNVPFGAVIQCNNKPTIIVNVPPKLQIPLFISHASKISDVKAALVPKTNMKPTQQEILYNAKPLKDQETLKSAGVPFGGYLVLNKLPTVIVVLPNGQQKPITDIELTDRVNKLENMLASDTKLPLEELALSCKGKPLKSDKTLEEQDIGIGETIDVVHESLNVSQFHKSQPLRIVMPDKSVRPLPNLTIDDNVAAVKAAAAAFGFNPDVLFYNDEPLSETGSLKSQGVQDGALLQTSKGVSGDTVKGVASVRSAEAAMHPGCSVFVDGPDCFVDEYHQNLYRSFERRVHWVMVVYAAILFALGVVANSLVKLLTMKVSASRDRFIRDFMETSFRTVMIVTIVLVLVEVVLNIDILGFSLEKHIFGKFEDEFVIFQKGDSNFLQVTFERMVKRVQFFLCGYLGFVLFLALIAWRNTQWLLRTDRLEMEHILEKSAGKEEQTYAALRYEFVDSVGIMAVRGLDPEFYNFVDYIRSCMLKIMTKLVRLRNTLLVFGFFAVFAIRPFAHYRHQAMVIVSLCTQAIPLLILLVIGLRCYAIKRKLLPRRKAEYLALRHQYALAEAPANPEELEEVGPVYHHRSPSHSTICCNLWIRMFYKTRYPNKHESLFWFWRGGPFALEFFYQFSVFVSLCSFAQIMVLINTQWTSWWDGGGYWPLITFYSILVVFCVLVPLVIWNMVLVTSTSGIIKDKVLSEVWELQRSQTIRRIARFIDALRIEATLYEIETAGETFIRQIAKKAADMTPEVKEQNDRIWADLDDDEDGQINLPQLYSFLTRQGLNIEAEEECRQWFEVFDIDKNGGIDRMEFLVVISIAKQLTSEPLDENSTKVLLTTKYNIDPTATEGVNLVILQTLIKSLHLQVDWNSNQILHLIEFISQSRRRRSLTLDEFIEGLKRLEAETLGTLVEAVGELRAKRPALP